jgi:hypothetical protein
MNAVIIINNVEFPVLRYQNQRVITTEHLAVLYGTETIRIQQNHARNLDRFQVGKHFFKIEGDELTSLKIVSSLVDKHTRSITLWTERGAARHAKMLETDRAWTVFDQLEDAYFNRPGAGDSSIHPPLSDSATINAIIDQLRVNRPSIPPLWLVMMWTLLEEIDQKRYPHPWAIRAVKDVHCLVFRPAQAVAYLSTAKHLQHLWQQTDPLGDRLLKRLLRQAGAIVKSRCDFTIGLQRFNHAIAIDLEALRPHKALPA